MTEVSLDVFLEPAPRLFWFNSMHTLLNIKVDYQLTEITLTRAGRFDYLMGTKAP
jgi:hypothetical protein